jgi:TRAP-type C4-dicarboxylate transport system permease small subunit
MLIQMDFFVLLIYLGFTYSKIGMTSFSPIMRLPMGNMYLALPLGGIIGLMYTFNTIRETIKKEKY